MILQGGYIKMKVSEHQYDHGNEGQGIKNLSYSSQHELLYFLIENISIQMIYNIIRLFGLLCHSSYFFDGGYSYLQQCLSEVCRRQETVFQSNVKYLKLKNIQKY